MMGRSEDAASGADCAQKGGDDSDKRPPFKVIEAPACRRLRQETDLPFSTT